MQILPFSNDHCSSQPREHIRLQETAAIAATAKTKIKNRFRPCFFRLALNLLIFILYLFPRPALGQSTLPNCLPIPVEALSALERTFYWHAVSLIGMVSISQWARMWLTRPSERADDDTPAWNCLLLPQSRRAENADVEEEDLEWMFLQLLCQPGFFEWASSRCSGGQSIDPDYSTIWSRWQSKSSRSATFAPCQITCVLKHIKWG